LAQMTYENATIYVSKVSEVDRTIVHSVDCTASTATGHCASTTAVNNTPMSDDYINVTDDQVVVVVVALSAPPPPVGIDQGPNLQNFVK